MHTLYRFYDRDGELLYVGITNNPPRRFSKHKSEKDWWIQVARIDLEQHPTREELQDAERNAVAGERPLHNIRLNGKSSQPAPVGVENGVRAYDTLEGRWFHSWIDDSESEHKSPHRRNGLAVEWQGQILERVDDSYLVQTYSWWDGSPYGGAFLVGRTQMRGWTFYRSSEEMQIALGCSEYFMGGRRGGGRTGKCPNPATHRTVVGNYVCWDCAEYYSSATEVS